LGEELEDEMLDDDTLDDDMLDDDGEELEQLPELLDDDDPHCSV
jgi:hypothetical protein